MEAQAGAASIASSTPTTPTSSASPPPTLPPPAAAAAAAVAPAGANANAVLASTADSLAAGENNNNSSVPPPRRRLSKIAARALSESKREGAAGGPPGFGQGAGSPQAPTPLTATPGGATTLGGSFRERVALRSTGKADLAGDQHGVGGSSKPGRSAHMNTGPLEARHLGRRPEVNMRRHEAGQAQKYAQEQQAKRAAVLRQQQSGSAGNFKTFDSSHNNYLIPVIPIQFAARQ